MLITFENLPEQGLDFDREKNEWVCIGNLNEMIKETLTALDNGVWNYNAATHYFILDVLSRCKEDTPSEMTEEQALRLVQV